MCNIIEKKDSLRDKKLIAVTGGTGHLGNNLIPELLDQGFRVRALVRNPEQTYEREDLYWIPGDLNDQSAIDALVKDAYALIHCASKISIGRVDRKQVYEVNVTGTQNLLNAIRKMPIRFIYISSSSAVKEVAEGKSFDEHRPLRSKKSLYYSWTKAQGESIVLEDIRQNNLDGLIIRPSAIVGPRDPGPSLFGQTILNLKNGSMPFVTTGGYNMVDVRDLSKTIINSISMGQKGGTYLAGGAFMSLEHLALILNDSKKPRILSLSLLFFILPLIDLYDRIIGLKWPVNRESLTTIKNAPKHMDCSKAQRELGHWPRPPEQSVKDLVTWFHENGMT